MHAPRPFGLAVYGGQLTADDLAFIDSIAKRLTNIKTTGELASLKLVYDLPDGGEVVVSDMGGIFRAVATKPAIPTKPTKADYIAHSHIPMLFSGVITKSIVGSDEGVGMTITEWTRKRLSGYDKNKKAPKQLALHRFVVDYNHRVKEFEPNPPPPRRHTQYTKQRPTWYSGSMAKVMQIVGGYGRQDLKNLPDDDWEQAEVAISDNLKKAIDKELSNKILPAYTGYPDKDGQFQYDYKHRHTNAVGFDDNRKPWLMSISAKGVYAMPLPIIPATATKAYREWIENVGDSEILAILDEFGALPSGESFPQNPNDFKAWKRAGVIIKVCDTADFYTHLAYSTAMGWSFNSLGTDGYNTCYNYNQEGLIVGYTYNMTLKLVSSFDNGTLSANKKTLDDYKAKELARYLSKLFQKIDGASAKGAAIRYKIRRLSDKELYERMTMSIDDWDNLTLDPIAKHTGQVRKVYGGLIWAMLNIKVPEPIFDGCISIMPDGWENKPKPKKTDTPILAYFVGDDLRVVKYYVDDEQVELEIESNFEEVMVIGEWKKIETMGKGKLHGDIYLTEKDDRVVYADRQTTTTIVGKSVGYTKASFQMDYYFWRTGTLYRDWYYTHHTKVKKEDNKKLSLGAIMPYYCRNLLLYAKTETTQAVRNYEDLLLKSVRDPHSYRIWTDTESMLLFGRLEVTKGKPYPRYGRPVWAEIHQYHPSQYNAFADGGDWVGGLPADVAPLIYDGNNWAKAEWAFARHRPAPSVLTYSHSSSDNPKPKHYTYLDNEKVYLIHQQEPDWYYEVSPDGFFNFCYKDACKNLMGDTVYANVSETVDGKRKVWGNSQFVNGIGHDTAHHFIGVINE